MISAKELEEYDRERQEYLARTAYGRTSKYGISPRAAQPPAGERLDLVSERVLRRRLAAAGRELQLQQGDRLHQVGDKELSRRMTVLLKELRRRSSHTDPPVGS